MEEQIIQRNNQTDNAGNDVVEGRGRDWWESSL